MNQPFTVKLPDFRNLGVLLRIFLIVEGLGLLVVVAYQPDAGKVMESVAVIGVLREPVLLVAVAMLSLLSPFLLGLPYRSGVWAVAALVFMAGLVTHLAFQSWLLVDVEGSALRTAFLSSVTAAFVLAYFNWRYHALSPALPEARLMALQARIRPHFLFNSLNTVLGLIRDDPRRAESVLENLAELYRALLSETGTLVPLGRELELARGYAEIEAMRLGERLRVDWQCQDAALDALVPPLVLQPLLENAIYHGIEPSESGGVVSVAIFDKGGQINLVMRNPCSAPSSRQGGNRMALDNIRERLDLHFDAEAEMSTYKAGGEFVVQIRMPCRRDRA